MNDDVRKAFREAWDRFMGDIPDDVVKCLEVTYDDVVHVFTREADGTFMTVCGGMTLVGDTVRMTDNPDFVEIQPWSEGNIYGFTMFDWARVDKVVSIDIMLEDGWTDMTDAMVHYKRDRK